MRIVQWGYKIFFVTLPKLVVLLFCFLCSKHAKMLTGIRSIWSKESKFYCKIEGIFKFLHFSCILLLKINHQSISQYTCVFRLMVNKYMRVYIFSKILTAWRTLFI